MYVCMFICMYVAPPSLSVGAVLEVEEEPDEQEEIEASSEQLAEVTLLQPSFRIIPVYYVCMYVCM